MTDSPKTAQGSPTPDHPLAGLFPRVLADHPLRCDKCAHQADYRVPRLVDWRDREAVELLARCAPTVLCHACGEGIPLDTPVVVLRPGDPASVLLCLPFHTDPEQDGVVLRAVLGHPAVPRTPEGRVSAPVVTALGDAAALAGRYTGFALCALSGLDLAPEEAWTDQERSWLAQLSTMVSAPPLHTAFAAFVQHPSEAGAVAEATRTGVLLDPVWSVVVDELATRTAALQVDPEALERVRQRAGVLRRLRLGAIPPTGQDGLDPRTAELLDRATEGWDAFAPERPPAIRELIDALRQRPDCAPLLVAALISYAARVSTAHGRTPAALAAAFEAAGEAIVLAPEVFGDDHAVTQTARQDYAALLLERQQGDPADNERQALALLEQAARALATSGDRALPTALHNWANALVNHNRQGRTDNQERAITLYRDALHVHRRLAPRDRRGELLLLLSTAAALRNRRAGNVVAAVREAHRLYTEVVDDPRAPELLSALELAQPVANLVNSAYRLHLLAPAEMSAAEVAEAARRAAVRLESTLREGDPGRIRTLSNIGGVLSHVRDRSMTGATATGSGGSDRDVAVRLTGQAYEEAVRHLPPGHEERLRVGANHASCLAACADDRPEFLARARELLRELLSAADPERSPGVRSVIAANLGRMLLRDGESGPAASVLETALDAVERLYQDAHTHATRLAELGEGADLVGSLVVAHILNKDTAAAVTAIERSRARLLRDTPAARAGRDGSPPTGRPTLYVGTGPHASWVVLVRPGYAPYGVLTPLTAADLRPLVTAVRAAGTHEELAEALDAVSAALGPAVLVPARELLREAGLGDIEVVTSGLLGGLPLHALRPPAEEGAEVGTEKGPEDGTASDCWLDLAVVRYIPGRWAATGSAPVPDRPGVVAVTDPRGGLDCALHEPEALPARLGARYPEPDGGDRTTWLLATLRDATTAHFACHAYWNPDDPLHSWIDLGAPHRLTITDVLDLVAPGLGLVVLSCCSTGVATESLADELLGFGTAFLLTGAKAVVCSTWDLADLSSSLVMCRFYRLLGRGADPAVALREAQLWLSAVTRADIERLVAEALDEVPGALLPVGLAVEAQQVLWQDTAPGHRPFRHPAAWAGFAYHGTAAASPEEGGVR
ncbi:CHAT domain-containing protein [Streptomyces sp. YKOK-I1]